MATRSAAAGAAPLSPYTGTKRRYYMTYACENTRLTLECDDATLLVVRAVYGRQSLSHPCLAGERKPQRPQAAAAAARRHQCMAPERRTTRIVASL